MLDTQQDNGPAGQKRGTRVTINQQTMYNAYDHAYNSLSRIRKFTPYGYVDNLGRHIVTDIALLDEAHRDNEKFNTIATSHDQHAEDSYVDPAEMDIHDVWIITWFTNHSDIPRSITTADYGTLQSIVQMINHTPLLNKRDSVIVELNGTRVYDPYFMEMDTEPKN